MHVARAVLFAAFLIGACGRGTPARDAGVRAAERLPETTLADVAVDDAKTFLDGVRGQFRDRALGVPIPANAAEIVERWATLPEPVRAHIPEASRLRVVFVERDGEVRSAVAVRIHPEADAAKPFGLEVPMHAGGPSGGRWVVAVPSPAAAPIALVEDTLVLADDLETLRATAGWLAREGMREERGAGLAVRVRARAFSGPLRRALDETLEGFAREAVATARAERARHEAAPALGEPEQFAYLLRDRLRRLLAYLPDLGDAELRVEAGASGAALRARVAVTPDTPLARVVAAANVGAPFRFGSLPAGTALAISSRRAPDEASWVELLAPIAGQRLTSEERTRLDALSTSISRSRGDASTIALGSDLDGPFVLGAFERGTVALANEDVRGVLGSGYVGSAIAALVGCDALASGSLATGRTALCRGDASGQPDLSIGSSERANVIALAVRPGPTTEPHGAVARLLQDGGSALFSDPDAERALRAMGDQTLLAVAVSGRSFVPSLGFVASPALRTIARSRAVAPGAAPLVFAVTREPERALGLRLAAPPRSLEELYSVGYLLASLMAGG